MQSRTVNPEPMFKTRAECVRHCKREAALSEHPRYAVHQPGFPEAPWRMQLRPPLIGQWWQIDPDGLTIQHA